MNISTYGAFEKKNLKCLISAEPCGGDYCFFSLTVSLIFFAAYQAITAVFL